MALKRLVIDGFGQLELNNVFFRRAGKVEAQCALGEDFAEIPAENGMLLAVDRVNRLVKFPVEGEDMPIALNYATEHMYDERTTGLKNFKLERGTFYPRMGFLSAGELFTTNCFSYDDAEFSNEEALMEAVKDKATLAAKAVYGGVCENGTIKLSATKPAYGPVLKAVEKTTMPDGQFALKLQVVAAQ